MVRSAGESAKITVACDAKKLTTLHDRCWWFICSIVRRIRYGKVLKLASFIE
jgi:hypothetical protein